MDTIGVSQTDFLSGEISMTFDLEKARAVCKTLPKYMNGACPCKEEAEAAKMLIKALPEIRRLQEFRDRVARILKQPLTDCDDLLILGLDARICQLRRQAAEIERLRGFETAARDLNNDLIRIAGERDELAARIQELEDALIEQEARFQYYVQNENCESWPEARRRYPELNEKYLKIARQHLHAEGKIGPDARPKCDHAWQAAIEERGYQTCLKCGECRDIKDIPRTAPTWQITEERKAAIMETIDLLNGDLFRSPYSDVLAVLRAMLTEAGQE